MKCITVEYIDADFDLCDLEIDGGSNNYIAEGIVVHNTWCCMGYHPDSDIPIVTSKGLSNNGLAFKFNEANNRNLYIQQYNQLTCEVDGNSVSILDKFQFAYSTDEPYYLLGEIFGNGIQDLTYGNHNKEFRIFDIYVGEPGHGIYLNTEQVEHICNEMGINTVPYLYRGPFNKKILTEFTTGKETISGTSAHMREGVVIRPAIERRDPEIGRVILKSVSEQYILRKGNVTEYN